MNIKDIEDLENEITKKSYHKANESKNKNWYWTSMIFQVLNIIICFFGLYLFLGSVIDAFLFKEIIIGIISFFILFFWERLKRQQIRSVSMDYLRDKKEFTIKQLPNLLITFFLIVCSSFIAIKGGQELSDKQDKIEITYDNTIKVETDSIVKYYGAEINKLQVRVDYIYTNAKDRKGVQRSLKKEETEEVNKLDDKIKELKVEKDKSLADINTKYGSKKEKQDESNSSVVMIFIVSSIIFELFIMFGVLYCAVYDFNSFYEITKSDNYRKKILFEEYLNVFYQNGKANKDERCISEKKFIDFIKIKYKNTLHIKEFLSIIVFLKIIETRSDRKRYYSENFEDAKTNLKEYIGNI